MTPGSEKSQQSDATLTNADRESQVSNDSKATLESHSSDALFYPAAKISAFHRELIVILLGYAICQVPSTAFAIWPISSRIADYYGVPLQLVQDSNSFSAVGGAVSCLLLGPFTDMFGRRSLLVFFAVLMAGCKAGVAFAPSYTAFVLCRALAFFFGVPLFTIGAAIVKDLFPENKDRTRPTVYLLFAIHIQSAISPIIGGACDQYAADWRYLYYYFWALSLSLVPLFLVFVPETAPTSKQQSAWTLSYRTTKFRRSMQHLCYNPIRVLRLFLHPGIFVGATVACCVTWGMFMVLIPLHIMMQERFHYTNEVICCLFYIPPGAGLLVGAAMLPWLKKLLFKPRKRSDSEVAEDSLKVALIPFGVILPAFVILYGWGIEKNFGGYPLVIICLFILGVGQSIGISSIVSYCINCVETEKDAAAAVAGNGMAGYVGTVTSVVAVTPMTREIGYGWTLTITGFYYFFAFLALLLIAVKGAQIRAWYFEREHKKRVEKARLSNTKVKKPKSFAGAFLHTIH